MFMQGLSPGQSLNDSAVQGYWQIELQGVTVNSQTPVQNVQSIIDTGSSIIIGDRKSVAALYAAKIGRAHV